MSRAFYTVPTAFDDRLLYIVSNKNPGIMSHDTISPFTLEYDEGAFKGSQ